MTYVRTHGRTDRHKSNSNLDMDLKSNIFTRGVGTCVRVGGARPKVGGQKTGILRKIPYFSAILVNFEQKQGGSCPPCPPVSNTPVYKMQIFENIDYNGVFFSDHGCICDDEQQGIILYKQCLSCGGLVGGNWAGGWKGVSF